MFKDLEFPRSVSAGLVWGPRYQTDIVICGGGDEVRNQAWSEPRREADAAKACETDQQRKDLIAFFRIVAGMVYSWKVRDWSDYLVTTSEGRFSAINSTTFQMVKRHTLDGLTADQDVTLPETATIYDEGGVLMVESTDYTLDDLTGILTILGSPAIVPTTWSGTYFVRARFDTDRIALVAETVDFFRSQSIPIIEVRYEAEAA